MAETENRSDSVTPNKVVLTITLHETGKVEVNGPLANEPLMFWLLEKAKDVTKAHNLRLAVENKSKITPVHNIANFVRNFKH